MGLQVYRSNDDEVTCWCPGHLRRVGREERNPSWSVNRKTGLHNCYSCGFSGTFLDLVMYVLFPNDVFRAARWMRQFGVNFARAQDLVSFAERTERVVEDEVVLVPETRLAMYDEVPDWALEERRLERESVDHYGVRWDSEVEAWIVPVRTPRTNELVGWQKKWAKRRRFMNEPKDMLKSLCLFGFDVFPVGEPAVLLESPLDVCRLHTAGFLGGLASYGAAVSRAQLDLIRDVTDEVVSALDDDKDGRLHAEELRVGKWERGKMVQPPFTKGIDLRFFDYGKTGHKDIGGMEQDDIVRGLYEARDWRVVRLGSDEQKRQRSVRGRAQAVPSAARRADGRPGPVPADRRRRNGKDPDDHRRARGAARRVR